MRLRLHGQRARFTGVKHAKRGGGIADASYRRRRTGSLGAGRLGRPTVRDGGELLGRIDLRLVCGAPSLDDEPKEDGLEREPVGIVDRAGETIEMVKGSG
jgi:hypothetical protein